MKFLKCGLETRFPSLIIVENALVNSQNFVVAAVRHPYYHLRWLSDEIQPVTQELFLKALETLDDQKFLRNQQLQVSEEVPPNSMEVNNDFYDFANQIQKRNTRCQLL